MYQYHPEIEGLKVNENGTRIFLNGEELYVKKLKRTSRDSDMLYTYVCGKNLSVAKLVCECWYGMAENPRWCATRKDTAKDFHHENLYWAVRGHNPGMSERTTKRSSLSKIDKKDIEAILKAWKSGETKTAIAKRYNTSLTSITRLINGQTSLQSRRPNK